MNENVINYKYYSRLYFISCYLFIYLYYYFVVKTSIISLYIIFILFHVSLYIYFVCLFVAVFFFDLYDKNIIF